MNAFSRSMVLALVGAMAFSGSLLAQGTDRALHPDPVQDPDRALDADRMTKKKSDASLDRPNVPDHVADEYWISPEKRAVQTDARSPGAQLSAVWSRRGLTFRVSGHGSAGGATYAAVIVGLEPETCEMFAGLPPLLCKHAVLGIGKADPSFALSITDDRLLGLTFYAQGILVDQGSVFVSDVIAIGDGASGKEG